MGVEVTYDSQSQLPQTNMYDMSIEYLRKNGKRAVICLVILAPVNLTEMPIVLTYQDTVTTVVSVNSYSLIVGIFKLPYDVGINTLVM